MAKSKPCDGCGHLKGKHSALTGRCNATIYNGARCACGRYKLDGVA